jgi:hypothetical protein
MAPEWQGKRLLLQSAGLACKQSWFCSIGCFNFEISAPGLPGHYL